MKKKDNYGNRRREKWNSDLQLVNHQEHPHSTKEPCKRIVMDRNGFKWLIIAPSMDTISVTPMSTVETARNQVVSLGSLGTLIKTIRAAPIAK